MLKTCRLLSFLLVTAVFSTQVVADKTQQQVFDLKIDPTDTRVLIHRDIFGQFVENIGSGIYGGIWVGPDSDIPNVRGIRKDVVQALREIKVPNVRWPGGCYADQYHWRHGIGPQNQRQTTINYSWGNVLDDNAFGTHEFMDFVQQLDSEAFLTVNMATGTVKEAADWVEYITTDRPTSLGKEREANGSKDPWPIKYLGLGNESWACGGAMRAEMYIDHMKLFSMFARNYHPAQMPPNQFLPSKNPMMRIAVGPGDGFEEYTEAVMKAWKNSGHSWGFEGIGLHRYTSGPKGVWRDSSTGFSEEDYAHFIEDTYEMDAMIQRTTAIMDKYDPDKKVMLAVDEWGNWLQVMPITNMFFLKQQNSLRDAIVAALHINIFARNADRVRLANIAQLANVLQSMVLTEGKKMVLTPTYYAFKMYVPFQDAHFIPVELQHGEYRHDEISTPQVDGIAAKGKDGHIYLALVNIDPNKSVTVKPSLKGITIKSVTGQVLTAPAVDSINSFDAPEHVKPQPFSAAVNDHGLALDLPAKSITVLRIDQ